MTQKRKRAINKAESPTKTSPDNAVTSINPTALIKDVTLNESAKKNAWEIASLGLSDEHIRAAAALAENKSTMEAARQSGLHHSTITQSQRENPNFNACVLHFRKLVASKFLDLGEIIAVRARREIEDGEAKDALGFSKLVTETMGQFRDQQIKELETASNLKANKFFDDDD